MAKRKKKQTLTNALVQVLVNKMPDEEFGELTRRREQWLNTKESLTGSDGELDANSQQAEPEQASVP